jgi:hypothetical protein
MDCRQVKRIILEQFGDFKLDAPTKRHLATCSGCSQYYEHLKRLEAGARGIVHEPLNATERAVIRDYLDSKINRYLNRATGFYRWTVRYGTSLAAVVLVVLVSYISGFAPTRDHSPAESQTYDFSSLYDAISSRDVEIDEEYVDLALYEYMQEYGLGRGELILGELSADEYEYLESSIDVGDIL